jgi:hypothetical protein
MSRTCIDCRQLLREAFIRQGHGDPQLEGMRIALILLPASRQLLQGPVVANAGSRARRQAGQRCVPREQTRQSLACASLLLADATALCDLKGGADKLLVSHPTHECDAVVAAAHDLERSVTCEAVLSQGTQLAELREAHRHAAPARLEMQPRIYSKLHSSCGQTTCR